jgi:hypothetical protein
MFGNVQQKQNTEAGSRNPELSGKNQCVSAASLPLIWEWRCFLFRRQNAQQLRGHEELNYACMARDF